MDRLARRGGGIVLGTAAVVYLLDRLTKAWAESSLSTPVDLIPGVLRLRFVTNPGGAFSFGTSAPWFFAGATIVVSVLIVATAFRTRSVWHSVALGLVLGGALGNLTDRIVRAPGLRGEVIDWIDVHIWPVFNVADMAIVCGAILLFITSVWSSKAETAVEPAEDAESGVPDGS
jgi:signal peptidase II